MSNLYQVTVTANNGSHYIVAATMDVAVKRALTKSYRTSKSLRIEAELSSHEAKVVYSIRRRDGTCDDLAHAVCLSRGIKFHQ